MSELDLHKIPSVARRVAHDELASRVSTLEAQLADLLALAPDVAKQLTSARGRLDNCEQLQRTGAGEQAQGSPSYLASATRTLFDRDPKPEELTPDWQIDAKDLVRTLISKNDVGMINPSIREALLDKFILESLHLIDDQIRSEIFRHWDPVRRYTIAAALDRIKRDNIPGQIAELGVYQGDTAVFYNQLCPDRILYLFDTFEGFPSDDVEHEGDDRFQNTSIELVKAKFSDLTNIRFRPGYFPETVAGLENETFSFVMLDADLYNPTLSGLEFFYDRMSPGGYIFIHDYTSYESNRAVSRAVDLFMRDKLEKIIDLPDRWGSVVFRKS